MVINDQAPSPHMAMTRAADVNASGAQRPRVASRVPSWPKSQAPSNARARAGNVEPDSLQGAAAWAGCPGVGGIQAHTLSQDAARASPHSQTTHCKFSVHLQTRADPGTGNYGSAMARPAEPGRTGRLWARGYGFRPTPA
jgi:hypothetical protein